MKTRIRLGKRRALKPVVLRARCEIDLKALIGQAALMMGVDQSDIIRIGTKKFANSVVYRTDHHAHQT